MPEANHPIEGQVVLLAGAQASVTLSQLSAIIQRAQDHVRQRSTGYVDQYECIDGTDGVCYVLAESGHWDDVGDELSFTEREADAVRRAHAEQFRRDGRRLDRLDEFETTLEVRDPVAMTAPPARSNR